MTEIEINEFIEKLRIRNDKKRAFFGFYQYGGGHDESCIRANKFGLELYAAELLESSIKSTTNNYDDNQFCYAEITPDWTDENSDFFFDTIEITNRLKQTPKDDFPQYNISESFSSKVIGFLFFLFLIIVIIMTIIGAITSVKWIFT